MFLHESNVALSLSLPPSLARFFILSVYFFWLEQNIDYGWLAVAIDSNLEVHLMSSLFYMVDCLSEPFWKRIDWANI